MLQSKLFPKTVKETPKGADNISTALLMRGGYINRLMAGSYTFETLGFRVIKKIEQIIREEMNALGGQEILMPSLHPKELWERSGRWSKLTGDMYQFKDSSDHELGLAMTHEETYFDLIGQQPLSYADLPINLYHFQNKYRDEARAKSGLLRTREFVMKDLYSSHPSEAEFQKFYNEAKVAYTKAFERMGIPTVIALASGGIFTDDFSHEYQSICEIGEDTIFSCPKGDYAVNDEVLDKTGKECPNHKIALEPHRAVEVGNIFPLGTTFSESMDVKFTAQDGTRQPLWSGCYGIGIGRSMGVIVEQHHDDNGIIWPKAVAPFDVHLIDLTKTTEEKVESRKVYDSLVKAGIDVLFDDRGVTAGAKFADSDLIGIPIRLVVSSKTLEKQSVEYKERASQDTQLIALDKLAYSINKL
jgi:prolyl-tRNA synthetase